MILYILYFIIILILILLIYDYSNYSKIKKISGGENIKSESILSVLFKIFFSKSIVAKRVLELKEKYKENIFGSYFLGRYVVYVTTEKLAKQIISDDSKVFIKEENRLNLKFMQEFIGRNNILLSNGEDWKRQRSSMNHAFFDLTKYNKIFQSKADIVYDMINKDLKQEDINDVIQKMALDVLGKCIFDYEFNSLSNDSFKKELEAYVNLTNTITNLKYQISFLFREKILRQKIKLPELDYLSNFFEEFIQKSRERMKENKEPKSIVDFMLTSNDKGGLTNEEIKSNT
jgi:cytochrome P450